MDGTRSGVSLHTRAASASARHAISSSGAAGSASRACGSCIAWYQDSKKLGLEPERSGLEPELNFSFPPSQQCRRLHKVGDGGLHGAQ
jgi:hypothetical protein